MSEARTQITTGIVRYPMALGSTLAESKGLVLSMTWLSSLLYGLPAAIVSADPVSVGRVVTAALSIALLITLFSASRSLGTSRIAGLIALSLLVSSRAYLFASHSCRTDLLAGLIVLLFVWRMIVDKSDHTARWWLAYGAAIVFLCLSSSIHLLTLLAPVALFLAWRRGAFAQWRTSAAVMTGAILMLAVLVSIYALSMHSLTLFNPHAHQFGDVLSSIPILRPFSRSVQVANVVIRAKQLWSEAPVALFGLAIIGIGAWRQGINRDLLFCAVIVTLSWLFLEGAEVNYLMHILPIVFLCFGLALSQLIVRRGQIVALAGLTMLLVSISAYDALIARSIGYRLDRSNEFTTQSIARKIASTWPHSGLPLVLSEPPSLERLSYLSQIRVMTDHFISLPERDEPIDSTLSRLHVKYAVLYNSPAFPKQREQVDSLYRVLMRHGTVIDREIGTTGDIGRKYFAPAQWQDTLILIQLHEQ